MNKTLSELPQSLQIITDSQDLQPIIADFHKKMSDYNLVQDQITGVAVETKDGDYAQVWFTEASNPWRSGAIYTKIL